MAEDKIKVQPVGGKFLSISVGNIPYEIYLVNPDTGEQGTYVPRKVAMALLAKTHPLISVCPIQKDGVFVQQFTPEELMKIQELRANPVMARQFVEETAKEAISPSNELVKAQAKLVEKQEQEIADKDAEIARLKAELEAKNNKADSKKADSKKDKADK